MGLTLKNMVVRAITSKSLNNKKIATELKKYTNAESNESENDGTFHKYLLIFKENMG